MSKLFLRHEQFMSSIFFLDMEGVLLVESRQKGLQLMAKKHFNKNDYGFGDKKIIFEAIFVNVGSLSCQI